MLIYKIYLVENIYWVNIKTGLKSINDLNEMKYMNILLIKLKSL